MGYERHLDLEWVGMAASSLSHRSAGLLAILSVTLQRVGRNARRRAEEKAAEHIPGAGPPENGAEEHLARCPRCGSTNLVEYNAGVGPTAGRDVMCGHCNWQGVLAAPGRYY